MDNKQNAINRLRPTKRRLIQLYAALLYNAQLKGFFTGEIYTGPLKNLCVPGLNCYSCPGAVGACPLGALQNALASSATRAPAYMLGIILLFGLLLGRTICGFLCPFGLIQELLYKLPTRKLKKNRVTRALSWVKYIILVFFVVAVPLIYAEQYFPVPAFCKYICPAGTLEGAIGLLSNPKNTGRLSMLGILFTRKFIILVCILTASVFIFRAFCRFLCPLGALYGLFCKVAIIGVKVDADRCTGCGKCVRACKMDIRHVGDHECIHCGGCAAECPVQAISFGGIPAARSEKAKKNRELAAWAAALVLLIGVLWATNHPAKLPDRPSEPVPEQVSEPEKTEENLPAEPETSMEPVEPDTEEPLPEVGSEPGMLLPDFTLPLYGEGEFSSEAMRGKTLVINFWATWCTPCVNELPYFEKLAAEYPDSVAVIALHNGLVTENVEAWLEREQLALSFALDENNTVLTSFGGSTVLPVTVVVSPKGIITYRAEGSVTYEKLLALVAEAEQ